MPRHVKLNGGKADSAKVVEAAKSPLSLLNRDPGNAAASGKNPFLLAGQKFTPHNPHRTVAFHTVLPQTAAPAEAFLKAIVALLIKGFAQKPTLRTKPNVT